MRVFLQRYLIWFLTVYFLSMLLFAKLLLPEFDLTRYALSDLGVMPQTALLFNSSLLLMGSGLILLFVSYRSSKSKPLPAKLGDVFLLLAAVSVLGIGLTPYDLSIDWHLFFAFTAGITAILAMVCYGLFKWPKAKLSLGLGVLSSVAAIFTGFRFQGLAICELCLIIGLIIWFKLVYSKRNKVG